MDDIGTCEVSSVPHWLSETFQQNVQQSCNHSNWITIAITGLFGLSGRRTAICYTVGRFSNALAVSGLLVNCVPCWKTAWGSGARLRQKWMASILAEFGTAQRGTQTNPSVSEAERERENKLSKLKSLELCFPSSCFSWFLLLFPICISYSLPPFYSLPCNT